MLNIKAYYLDVRSFWNKLDNYFKMDKRYCNAICVSYDESRNRFYNESGSYILEKGKVLFIPQGVSYELQTEKSGYVGLINFMGSMELKDIELHEFDNYDKILNLFREMEMAESEYERLSKFYSLVDYIDRASADDYRNSAVYSQIEFIRENYSDSTISNDLLAKMTNISEIYFRKVFKETTGVSPHKFLLNIRISNAKKLLKQNTMTIEEISSACGFSNLYYFSYAFKKGEGMSPRDYAKMYRFI